MLKRLYIKNFALVSEMEVNFDSGLNIITGETGAGKSVIIGALAQVLGERTDKDDIRSGESASIIEAEFNLSDNASIANSLKKIDISTDNNSILIRKEMFAADKPSRIFINDQLVTVKALKSLTEFISQLYGQHSHQQLINEQNHLIFLDSFAGLTKQVDELALKHNAWRTSTDKLTAAIRAKENSEQNRELMLFQKEEIEKAQISIGEEDELLAERKILDSASLLGQKCSAIFSILENDNGSVIDGLNSCAGELSQIVRLDNNLKQYNELLENASVNIEEFRSGLESYMASIPDDPHRLEEINQRLDELYRLKNKYGGSEKDILDKYDLISVELGRINNFDNEIEDLSRESERLKQDYADLAIKISRSRQKASAKLTKLMHSELSDLAISDAGFECEFMVESDSEGIEHNNQLLKAEPTGLENIRFMFSANPGEPLKPLSNTASGGEISRVMLALKTAEQKVNKKAQTLLVFDEIDSGIGGQTANALADKLASLAGQNQLLVITHLHQIAAKGDHHFAVSKSKESGKSKRHVITLKKLLPDERAEEIKRMISMPEIIVSSED